MVMHPLTASETLAVWEAGQERRPVERAVALLVAAGAASREEVLALPLGQRDGLLLTLRSWAFGARLGARGECPACGAAVELDVAADDLRAPAANGHVRHLARDGVEVTFRPPSSGDVLDALDAPASSVSAPARLLERCVEWARADGEELDPEDLPAGVRAVIAGAMAEADPQAAIEVALVCPACAKTWLAPLDLAGFFWAELDAWARRTLREVHVLASAYGWSEGAILDLSPWRRHLYRELVEG